MAETRATRPRRSRLGLVLVLGLALALAAELIGALVPGLLPTTPSRFLGASWAVATGGAVADDGGELAERIAFEPRPYVMWGLRPGFTRASGDGRPLRTSNSLGFRGAEIELPKPPGRTRILCLGGSTTYAFAVDDDAAYPHVLGELLRAEGHDVDVVNGGVESYTSAESLANLAFRGLALQPDLAVIYHAANDVRPRRYADFREDYAHYRRNWNGSVAGYDPTIQGETGGVNQFLQYPPPSDQPDAEALLATNGPQAFARNLTSLIGVCRAHGVQPVLVSFTPHPDPGDASLALGIAEHNAVLAELAAEHDVPLIDLGRDFPRDAELFVDDIHLGVEGNRIKARLIAEGLGPLLP